ncbi:hypothetical protein DFP72DRAFT_1040780 [Ephemerocybe angulata]|uniref:Uncharacterized protein n=1 Tax=Ephemerocybe angulata TaxID=980116 RepID=A0A8H6MFB3_9AGAR|nr:hypothetical protein DFP72DRAFT_1040780 [Tulosesus angulatus]
MSYSTTATSRYLLAKYSRAYPSKASKTQAPGQEWQHFNHPTISVVLDKCKSRSGELVSLRMKILWIMNEGDEGDPKQPPVVLARSLFALEDLDLFSFSDIEKNPPKRQHSEGLPLKAVCRDTLVGIRYLFSKPDSPQPVYRRFQVTFMSLGDATDFAQAIRTVCPCKTVATAPQTTILNSGPTMANIPAQMLPPRPPTLVPSATHTFSPQSSYHIAPMYSATQDYPRPSSSVSTRTAVSNVPESLLSSSPLNPETRPSQNQTMGPPSYIPPPRTAIMMPPTEKQENQNAFQPQNPRPMLPPSSPLPPSDPGSDRAPDNSNTQPMTPLPQTMSADAIIASLRESTGFYDLSNEALEQVVAHIVREDGFLDLMERLSAMWRVHSLIGLSVP